MSEHHDDLDPTIQELSSDDRRLQLEVIEKNKRIGRLKQCIRNYEEDCACLPEDASVTETVNALRARIAKLEDENAVLLHNIHSKHIPERIGELESKLKLSADERARCRREEVEPLKKVCRSVIDWLESDDPRVSVIWEELSNSIAAVEKIQKEKP